MLGCVALVRTDVSEELSASFIRVTRIGELGTTLAVTSNWHAAAFLGDIPSGGKVTIRLQLVPRYKKTWIYTSNPPVFMV
jgi:hypothetical protein